MENILTRNWWLVTLRGAVALIFGLLTVTSPLVTLAVLILFFGAYALLNGILTVVTAIVNRRGEPHWVAMLIGGVLGIAVGIITFMTPGATGLVLLYYIAAWAILTGIFDIAAGIRLRKMITREWVIILSGVLSLGFGIVLVLFPGAGALAVALWIGWYAVVFGFLMIVAGFRLRGWGRARGASDSPGVA